MLEVTQARVEEKVPVEMVNMCQDLFKEWQRA
jgi:hypothetical protein